MQLKKNDEIQLNITALTSEGSAIGRKDGVPVFVRGGVPGDVVTAHIIKAKKNYAVARLQQVLEPSPHRVESDCPVSAQCGGCAFRTVDYAEELRFKQQRIDDAFQRIGHLDLQVEGVLAAPDTVRYRNKAQYPVQLQDGRPVAGFYAYKSHRVVPTGDCLLQCTDFSAGVAACLQWAEEHQISVYNEETGTGLLRHLYFRKGQATGQVLACIVINGTDLPGGDALCAALHAAVPGLVGVVLNSNTRRTNVILGDRDRVLWGKGELLDYLAANGGRAFVPREDEVLTNMAAERDGLAAEYYSVALADGIAHHLEGDYNRFNIAAAVAVGRYFDIDGERIRHAVGSYMPDNNRSQRTETERNTLIVDCYNANPSSMRASVLNFLAEPAGGRSRRVLILGDMLELGAWSEQEHRDIVALAGRNPDTELMLVGGEFARVCTGMEPQPANTALFPSREELIAELRRRPIENAFVLVKGSRGIGLEKALEEL